MKFLPHNRNISIELIEKKEEDTGITVLLPSDYRPAQESYAVVRVSLEGAAADCQGDWASGSLLVVEAQMIREISHGEETYHTITENHVVGSLVPHDRA